MDMEALANHLNMSTDELEESGIAEELEEDRGSSGGDMVYSYFFEVPESTPPAVLKRNDWDTGQNVNGIPVWIVDSDSEE